VSLTIEDLRKLAWDWTRGADDPAGIDARSRLSTLRAADVLPHLDSDDRNVRVAALRVLAILDDPAAAEGIVRGLDDEKKRVREVAAKSSVRFAHDPIVSARLALAVERHETGSSGPALAVIVGLYGSPYGLASTAPVAGAIAALARLPKYRTAVLSSLLRLQTLTDEATTVLKDFVSEGSKDEAVAATRRLCGYRVAHHAELTDDVRRRAEAAHGRVWFWVRVDDAVPSRPLEDDS
jgi:HEAT repeat protein